MPQNQSWLLYHFSWKLKIPRVHPQCTTCAECVFSYLHISRWRSALHLVMYNGLQVFSISSSCQVAFRINTWLLVSSCHWQPTKCVPPVMCHNQDLYLNLLWYSLYRCKHTNSNSFDADISEVNLSEFICVLFHEITPQLSYQTQLLIFNSFKSYNSLELINDWHSFKLTYLYLVVGTPLNMNIMAVFKGGICFKFLFQLPT